MCCITLTALEATMATTEVLCNAYCDVFTPWLPRQQNRGNLQMNWVVVTGENGQPSLCAQWKLAE